MDAKCIQKGRAIPPFMMLAAHSPGGQGKAAVILQLQDEAPSPVLLAQVFDRRVLILTRAADMILGINSIDVACLLLR